MRKDYKSGLLVGLVFVAVLIGWVATRQNLSIESRILNDDGKTAAALLPATSPPAANTQPPVVTAAPAIEHKQPEKPPEKRTYTVQKGETLSDISFRFYGTANKWLKIQEANKETIKDPTQIKPGMKLIIPD